MMEQQEQPGIRMETWTVITTVVNERLQYVKSLATTQLRQKFIPNYTTDKKKAYDFERNKTARKVLKKIVPPNIRVFIIDTIEVEAKQPPKLGGVFSNDPIKIF